MNPMEKQFSVTRPASKTRFPIGRNIAGGSSAESGQFQELTPLQLPLLNDTHTIMLFSLIGLGVLNCIVPLLQRQYRLAASRAVLLLLPSILAGLLTDRANPQHETVFIVLFLYFIALGLCMLAFKRLRDYL